MSEEILAPVQETDLEDLPPIDPVDGPVTIKVLGPCGVNESPSGRQTISYIKIYTDKPSWGCFAGKDRKYKHHVHIRIGIDGKMGKMGKSPKFDMCLDPETAADLARGLWSYAARSISREVLKGISDA